MDNTQLLSSIKIASIITSIFLLSANIVIFYYLTKINKSKQCYNNCEIRKHYLNKLIRGSLMYNATFAITLTVLNLIPKIKLPIILISIGSLLYIVSNGIFMIGLFIYYNKIEKTECECLKNKPLITIHKFIGMWRSVLLFGYSMFLLGFLINISIGFYNKIKKYNEK
jgi:hypothetical protein